MAGALVGLTLLIIGDSHLSFPDSLLKSLPDALAAEGATVTTYGVYASRSTDWGRQQIAPGDWPARNGLHLTAGSCAR